MSYHQHRSHDSSQGIEGISLSDFRSSSTSYQLVTGYEEANLGDENSSLSPVINRKPVPSHSSLRPIITRKPVPSPSQTFAPINPVNHHFTNNVPRPLPRNNLWKTLSCLLLGTLSIPFYVLCGFAWHYHSAPVLSQNQWNTLDSFGSKV
jgi:hypothetical protein